MSFDWSHAQPQQSASTVTEEALVTPQENDLTTLTHSIIEWRRLKEACDGHRQQLREFTKKMKALEEIIVRVMKNHNIGALDLKNSGGRVLFKKQKRQGSLGQKAMEHLVADFLKSAEQAKNLMTHLQENRGVVIKETICYENASS
jgi:hypothetical protein